MKTHLASCLRPLASVAALAALAVAALPQSAHAQAVTVTTLANFDGTNGVAPYTALTLGRDGNFYGTTDGNPNNSSEVGTIFKLTPAGSLTTLFSFNGTGSSFPDGKNPNGLIQASDGNIYGTTARFGGPNKQGTLFVITPAGALTTVHRFDAGSSGNIGDGELPNGIIQGRDGNLYGDTHFAGAPAAQGTLFRASTGGAIETLSYFTDPNVSSPHTALVQGSDGSFYGTTSGAGTGSNDGAVFKFTPGGGPETLVIFNGPNGYDPEAELIQATDGNFYGTTAYGGTNNSGTVFRMTPAGQLTTLVNFNGPNGSGPRAALLQARDGNFYGTTAGGGTYGLGTVFKLTPAGELTTLFSPPIDRSKGEYPRAALIQAPNGDFYGTTLFGGSGGRGTVFRLNISPERGAGSDPR